jgi:hypothetical protein
VSDTANPFARKPSSQAQSLSPEVTPQTSTTRPPGLSTAAPNAAAIPPSVRETLSILARTFGGFPRWLRRAAVAMAILLVLVIVSLNTPDAPAPPPESAADATPVAATATKTVTLEKSMMGGRHVEGVIRNNSDKVLSYVVVEINLYNDEGAQVGSTLDTISNLDPHTDWNFAALVANRNASRYRVVDVRWRE